MDNWEMNLNEFEGKNFNVNKHENNEKTILMKGEESEVVVVYCELILRAK